MMRVIEVFRTSAERPIEAIQATIAIMMLVTGLYTISPLYQTVLGTNLVTLYNDSFYARLAVGVFVYIIPSMPILLSLFNKKFATIEWYQIGTFWMFLSLMFTSIMRILSIGPRPLVWLLTLALGAILGICRVYWKVKK